MIALAIVIASLLIVIGLFFATCTVKVREGKAKLMMNPGERYSRTIINWSPYMEVAEDVEVDGKKLKKGDIVKRSEVSSNVGERIHLHIPFTAFFLKFPWEKAFYYNLEMAENHEMAKKGERLNYLDLKEQKLESEIVRTTGAPASGKESKESSFGKVDVTVSYLVIMRIKNPYEFIFDSPSNGYEATLARLDNAVAQVISQCEQNLLEQMEGDSKALWFGIANPEKADYSEIYKNMSNGEIEDLKKEHREIWKKYKQHISHSEDVDLVFKGIGDIKLVKEEFKKWGVKIIDQGIELRKVDPSEDFKKWREEIKKEMMTKEKMKEKLGQEEIMAQIEKVKGQGKSDRYDVQMNLVNSIAASLAHSGYKKREAIPLAKEILETLIAGEEGNLEKKIFKGLDGNNISSIAAQLELGRQMMTGTSKENKAGFKTGEKDKSEEDKDEKEESEEKSFAFVDEEGNEKFTF